MKPEMPPNRLFFPGHFLPSTLKFWHANHANVPFLGVFVIESNYGSVVLAHRFYVIQHLTSELTSQSG